MNQQHGIPSILLPWAVLLIVPFVLLTFMAYDSLSDDQISYFHVINLIEAGLDLRPWALGINFLYWLSSIGLTEEQTLSTYFTVAAVLYLCAMYFVLSQVFLISRWISVLIAIVSLAPIYTLGMTYWGFARYEMILPRILVLWMAPLFFGLAIKWRLRPIRWSILTVAFIGVCFNLSVVFLIVTLALFLTLSAFHDRKWRLGLGVILITSVSLYGINAGTHAGLYFYNDTPASVPLIEKRWSDLTKHETRQTSDIALQWEAAKVGFWWALFPPKLTDIAYFVAGAFFVIVFGIAGLRYAVINERKGCWDLLLLGLCVFAVAYGYQLCRFLAWRTLDWGPYFYEEVRAFRLIMFPLYVGAGWFLMSLYEKRRYFCFLICALALAAPMTSVIRWLPEDSRIMIAAATHKIFPEIDTSQKPYLNKALNIQDKKSSHADLLAITKLLRGPPFPNKCVISTEHRLKLSGRPVIIAYHDKRGGRRVDALVKWYLTYNYVTAALQSRDALQIVHTANHFDCAFVVTDYMMENPNLSIEYAGENVFLYRVISGKT